MPLNSRNGGYKFVSMTRRVTCARPWVKVPMFGCDCYAYGLLASGFCDLVVEADLKPYDYMALVPIIKVGCCNS
jgi:fructose-1,6-bisphosphatase/inositol monophosphatase family enzyme